jgi:hypothetical protein
VIKTNLKGIHKASGMSRRQGNKTQSPIKTGQWDRRYVAAPPIGHILNNGKLVAAAAARRRLNIVDTATCPA